MKNIDLMMQKYVETAWCPSDVKNITNWSDKKCMDALDKIAPYMEDRLIELGWEVMEDLLRMYYDWEGEDA